MTDTDEQPRTLPAIVVACAASLVSTMLGIGGGVLMVPLLTMFARVQIKRAAGTSLAMIFLVIVVGLAAQELKAPGDIVWPVSMTLAAGAIAGAFIGRWLNKRLPDRLFRYAFCVVLVVAGVRLLGAMPKTAPLIGAQVDLSSSAHVVYLVGAGLFAGVVAALFGLGGGVVAVPALALAFGFFQDNFTATRATSLGMILPTSLVGAVLHARAGNVDKRLVARMAPFALVFATLGVLVAYAVPAGTLKVIFGVLLLVASLRLALTKRTGKS